MNTWHIGILDELTPPKKEGDKLTYTSIYYEGTESGTQEHIIELSAHDDGSIYAFERNGEGYIFLYPQQVKHLKRIMNAADTANDANVVRGRKIYVAGPYTQGDVETNIRNAFTEADKLVEKGFLPFVPHASHLWHMISPKPYEFWLDLDLEYLKCCDGLLCLPGYSPGADLEVDLAERSGIPVFHDIEEIIAHFKQDDPK